MAMTPALSPEPPTDLSHKPSAKLQIAVPSLKPPQVLQQSLKKKQEAIGRAPKPRCVRDQSFKAKEESTHQNDHPDQPFRNQPSSAQSSNRSKNHQHFETLQGRPECEATLTMREEIPADDGHSLPRFGMMTTS
ncbi:hypothetical protein E4U61_000687 [Claviceps capensis]|nr:hypothetical protein E4U61_000687 [Claviceps capensis]